MLQAPAAVPGCRAGDVHESLRRALLCVAPAALLRDIACFTLCAQRTGRAPPGDLALCTRRGELLVLAARTVRAAASLEPGPPPTRLAEFWTSCAGQLFLLSSPGRLHVYARGDDLDLLRSFYEVDRYSIVDPQCRGTPLIKIWRDGEDLPLLLNENFEEEGGLGRLSEEKADGWEFESSLRVKLTEARYTVANNEKRHDDLLRLRQAASHIIIEEMCPNAYDATFKNCKEIHEALSAGNLTPWIKLCNGRVVLGVAVSNDTMSSSFRDIRLILQSHTDAPVTYNTRIYEPTATPPFWHKKNSNELNPKSKATIVAVTDVEEFSKDNAIQYNGLVAYRIEGNEKFLPLQGKMLTCLETMGGAFDALSSNEFDSNDFVSILATTIDIDLNILQVASTSEDDVPDLMSLFVEHLRMERVTENVLVHRASPYHALSGVVVLIKEAARHDGDGVYKTTVYLRNKSQLPSLLRVIYDGIPYRLIVTAADTIVREKLTSRIISAAHVTQSSMDIDEVLTSPELPKSDKVIEYGKSLCAQMSMVLRHFDDCIVAMATSKSSAVTQLIGEKIDILSSGQEKYVQFVSKLNEEIRTGNTFLS